MYSFFLFLPVEILFEISWNLLTSQPLEDLCLKAEWVWTKSACLARIVFCGWHPPPHQVGVACRLFPASHPPQGFLPVGCRAKILPRAAFRRDCLKMGFQIGPFLPKLVSWGGGVSQVPWSSFFYTFFILLLSPIPFPSRHSPLWWQGSAPPPRASTSSPGITAIRLLLGPVSNTTINVSNVLVLFPLKKVHKVVKFLPPQNKKHGFQILVTRSQKDLNTHTVWGFFLKWVDDVISFALYVF